MAEQDGGQGTQDANGGAGGAADQDQKTGGAKTYTADELQREADRRVTEAQKKWKAEQDALLTDTTKNAETKLAELKAKTEEAERYADFIEKGTASGIRNHKAAYLVAKHGDYFDKKGNLELERFKKENPEFFGVTANADAGRGAGGGGGKGGTMNDFIRAAAGR